MTALTRKELEGITGRKHFSKMCEWLNESGIPYRARVDGKPILTWGIYEQSLLKGASTEPDLEWFKKAG